MVKNSFSYNIYCLIRLLFTHAFVSFLFVLHEIFWQFPEMVIKAFGKIRWCVEAHQEAYFVNPVFARCQ